MRRPGLLRDERGIALIMAVCFMFVLSIMLAAIIQYSSASSRGSDLSKGEQNAFSLAEAGFNNAASKLLSAADPSAPGLLPASEAVAPFYSYPNGQVKWWGTRSAATPPLTWTIFAVSSVPNPTGGTPLTRRISGEVDVTSGPTIMGNEAWNFVYSANTTSCLVLQNSFKVAAPLYVQGNLCLQNTAAITGPEVDVRGKLQTEGNQASVGSGAAPVDKVYVQLGCRNLQSGNPPFQLPCTPSHRVWAGTFSSSPPVVNKPPSNIAAMYSGANIGPARPCVNPPGAFDTDSTALNPGGRKVDLMPNNKDYNCQVGSAYIRWTRGDPGTFQISGSVFFDANLLIQGNTKVLYRGKGTIYGSGTVSVENSVEVCGIASCSTSWNPNVNMLTLVAGSSNVPAWTLGNNTKFQGGAYAVGGFSVDNSAEMTGPTIADVIEAPNSATFLPWTPLTAAPVGAPVNGTGVTADYKLGSWRG